MSKTINRRRFIQQSAGLAAAMAAPTLIPSSALGKAGSVAPSDRVTMGFIGTGGQGNHDMRNFLEKKGAQVVAICDVDQKNRHRALASIRNSYGNVDGILEFSDFRELLARSDIDAVCQATPDHWHALINVAAARAGKDIYAEKPLSYTISEGRAIVDAVEKHGVIFQTGSQQRSEWNFRFACELVRNNYIGNVKNVTVWLPYGNGGTPSPHPITPVPDGFDYNMWLGPAPLAPYTPGRCHGHFRWVTDYSSGQLTDWAGHHCDIAQWGMNTEHTSPVEIQGEGIFPDPVASPLYNTAYSYRFTCDYKEGFRMTVESAERNPRGQFLGTLFEGSEGWVYVRRGFLDAHPKSLLRQSLSPKELRLYQSDDHFQNFLNCVKTRQKTVAPADVAHRSITIAHLGTIAMKTGRKIIYDPQRETFQNDVEANKYLFRPMRGEWTL